MKSKKLVVVAVILGFLAVLLVNSHVGKLREKAEEPKKVFFRANDNILPGMTVKEAYQKKLLSAVKNIPESFARSYPQAIEGTEYKQHFSDERIERAVPAGEFLQIHHLEAASSTELARMVPVGHSRVAIPATQRTAVGFLPAPGDVVDVYRTIVHTDPSVPGGKRAEAIRVVSGMTVFAIDDYYGAGSGTVRPRGRTYSSITLSGPTAQIEQVIAESKLGDLTLTLPGRGEDE